jgi:coenzyme F420 hydrogenase subunit beta
MANASRVHMEPPVARLDRLKAEVLDTGLCVACGACVGLCPHLLFYDGLVAAPDDCGLAQGRCYDICPQALEPDQETKRKDLHALTGQKPNPPLGPSRSVWQARATAPDLEGKVQYGGVVSTLMALALENGIVDEAVLTKADKRGAPQGVRVRDRDGVLAAAGSLYAAGASLQALNQALAEDAGHKLGLVGLPCQALAASSMKAHPDYPAAAKRLGLVIGLFCTWNLPARGLRTLLASQGVAGTIKKYDIPPPPAEVFVVETDAGIKEIPLAKVRERTLLGCALCPDMTAELADISVGAVEGRPGWNTVLVRTEAGESLLKEAEQQGLITLEEPAQEAMDHLRLAAEGKRTRAAAAWKER